MAVNKKCPKCGSENVQLSNESSKHGCLFLILFWSNLENEITLMVDMKENLNKFIYTVTIKDIIDLVSTRNYLTIYK